MSHNRDTAPPLAAQSARVHAAHPDYDTTAVAGSDKVVVPPDNAPAWLPGSPAS